MPKPAKPEARQPETRATFMTDADEERILALVITASSGAMQINEQSARLRQAADLFPDFAHYSKLLRRSMKQAFDLGKAERKRRTGAAKGSWRRIFKHFARRLGIEQAIEIVALDRAGNYDCRMTAKVTPDREWRAFVKQGGTISSSRRSSRCWRRRRGCGRSGGLKKR